MNWNTLQFLLSDKGKYFLLREQNSLDVLSTLTRLRKELSNEHSSAIVKQVFLRKKAISKFTQADKMFFTQEALEQSTGEIIANHRAKRFIGMQKVADLTCGIGGDTIAISKYAKYTYALDIDPIKTAITRHNANCYNRKIDVINNDINAWFPITDAVFIDPSRRADGERFKIGHTIPSLDMILETVYKKISNIGIKLSPLLNYEMLEWDGEIEIISENNICKEIVLWNGDLTTCKRRATILPSGISLIQIEPTPKIEITRPLNYIYEPDKAIIRAKLIRELAITYKLKLLDKHIAYLTSDYLIHSPLLKSYKVIDIMPFNLKKLRAYLRKRKIGKVIIKKRAFPLTPEELQKKLHLKGDKEITLIATTINQIHTIFICENLNKY